MSPDIVIIHQVILKIFGQHNIFIVSNSRNTKWLFLKLFTLFTVLFLCADQSPIFKCIFLSSSFSKKWWGIWSLMANNLWSRKDNWKIQKVPSSAECILSENTILVFPDHHTITLQKAFNKFRCKIVSLYVLSVKSLFCTKIVCIH